MDEEQARKFLSMTTAELHSRIRAAREELARAGHRKQRVDALTYLGFLLNYRYARHTEVAADIDESVEKLREAVALAPAGHTAQAKAERLLISTLCARGRPGDLAESFDSCERLLRPGRFDPKQDCVLLLQVGTIMLGQPKVPNQATLNKGITMLAEAEEQLAGGRSLAERLVVNAVRFTLAIALVGRSGLLWSASQEDLPRARALLSIVDTAELEELVPGFGQIRQRLQQAMGYLTPYLTGESLDLPPESAQEHTPASGGILGRQIEQLGGITEIGHGGTNFLAGDLRAGDEQIDLLRAELDRPDIGEEIRGSTLVHLAHVHHTRFRHRHLAGMADAREDLDAAEGYARAAFELSHPGSVASASSLLGITLFERCGLGIGDAADLDEAIRLMYRAIASYPEQSRNALAMGTSLSEALLFRATQPDGRYEDVEEAERLLVTLYERLPAGSPLKSVAQARLATFLQCRCALTNDTEDRLRAALASRDAAQAATHAGSVWAYDTAALWARWAWDHGTVTDRADAHQLSVRRLAELARAQLGRGYAELALRRISAGLIARAGIALTEDRRPADAVVAIETGRAVLLSTALERDGVQLDDAIPTSLRERFTAALARLSAAEAELSGDVPPR